MTLRKRIFILGFIITLISIVIYSSLRTEMFEKEYTEILISSSNKIGMSLKNFQKAETLKDIDLLKFFQILNKQYRHLGLVAIADKENRILNINKNNRYFESNELLETIIRDFQNDGFKLKNNKPFLVRYYNQIKFYIFVQNTHDGRILIMFPYILNKTAKTKLVLELLLIIIINIIIFSSIYLYLQKTGKINAEDRYKIIDIDGKRGITPARENRIVKDIENVADDSLNRSVYELFKTISSNFSADIISLYIMKEEKNRLEKKFELKGNTFFKIDSSDFDSIEIDNEIGQELKNFSIFVMENSRKITFPLSFRNSLIGAVIIFREKSFTGHEINDIKIELEDITKLLSEYILLNDVIVDKETGLYSKAYFRLKYDELDKLFLSKHNNFAVILVSAFSTDQITEGGKNSILIKKISARIMENLNTNDIICRYDNHFSILMPGADKPKASNTAEKIVNSLNKLEIRVGKSDQYILNPFIGFVSTEQVDNVEDLLDIAEKSLEYAMTKRESNIQSVKIKNVLHQE